MPLALPRRDASAAFDFVGHSNRAAAVLQAMAVPELDRLGRDAVRLSALRRSPLRLAEDDGGLLSSDTPPAWAGSWWFQVRRYALRWWSVS